MTVRRSGFLLSLSFSLLAFCGATQVRAESLCTALKGVLDDANNEFRSYRGSFDFTLGEYQGKRALYPLTDCHTQSADGVATYECALRKLPDDMARVKGQLDSIHAQVVNCLGADVKITRKRDDQINYRYLPEDKNMTLRFQRMTPTSKRRDIPPSYSLMFAIDAVDLYKK